MSNRKNSRESEKPAFCRFSKRIAMFDSIKRNDVIVFLFVKKLYTANNKNNRYHAHFSVNRQFVK